MRTETVVYTCDWCNVTIPPGDFYTALSVDTNGSGEIWFDLHQLCVSSQVTELAKKWQPGLPNGFPIRIEFNPRKVPE